MCVDLSPPAPPSAVRHDVEIADPVRLDPVDAVEVISLMGNVTDVFMPDQGPARRAGFFLAARRDCGVMAGGTVPDALVAGHGFSMLITVRKGERTHRILFDTGISPDGVVANMRRLDLDRGDHLQSRALRPHHRPGRGDPRPSIRRPGLGALESCRDRQR